MNFEVCAICGRTILRGERSFDYVDPQGEHTGVCPLCKPRAEEMGWVPAEFASAAPRAEPRRRGAAALRERIARTARTVGAAPEPEEPSDPPPPPTPLEVFNASSEVRKVAGVRRSLGDPRVCMRPDPEGGELVIVAWDLSWYRWSIRGTTVKQVAKGNEISELPVEDRDWNATAAADGTLTVD